jgi:AraC-like DNA-binding protein
MPVPSYLLQPATALASLGRPSHVIHTRARQHYWSGVGPLSIKTFFNGRALYRVQGGWAAVDERAYLILNEGQEYSITVDSDTAVESFCLFFAPGLADEVRRSLTANAAELLDDPASTASTPVQFFERTYPHDDALSPALFHLRAQWDERKAEQGWMNEQLRIILQKLLDVHDQTVHEVAQMPALRAATREELYRRLHCARDYVDACYDQPLTLEDIARLAGLSPNHLLRTFKQAFHSTPHQYLTARRLERAQWLLAQSELSVTDVCLSVGFESLGSFSWLFRRRFGLSPQAYRHASQMGDFEEARRLDVVYPGI